ncbi:MAG: 4-hydroxy-tetrahydrodipicolinate synthase [Planctomycetia bacterium]|uniref:4-hydroxy-tetrahydrodipicolinate synthase n=1 Tax=Candidatus Brocadia sapporoensis TaxID=392547 RepID=A0A1V6LX31_9BACT|nr:4-hydroxy-tetrahydrodipicolinate synthase [Candidatus Brocadia sapporoensis]MCC7239570.1 4-hydroxy-tetrahydrodipicolinate synthase [Candidatus Brocadia sp.]QOJ05692.1 MAG: 4-hydroxy-tetrahydrodipicolinate synthase [Planctomycetia bacterium]TVL97199.1 MAG: 4-hydroxy-tetrahydrodipicolinate synthase [Candidatus Brocadia sp. BL1]MDG6006120.1 4-hydroxy-tetrahydrodipicolinate synthase [Candidatus Brocadia sp.]OQD44686.1 4-hydroxy-tetrahydrodipicolinate synthase [Candidatus Brocadia sapporoensis]
MFHGSYVALVTPFKNGQVDYQKLGELVEFHVKNGTQGIVPCGTTGESATLSFEEHEKIIGEVVSIVAGRIRVLAGAGSNNTTEALRLAKHAKKIGADGALLITPYYNKPTPEGLYRHYKLIAESVDIPIVMYNVPSRTGISIQPETVARLSEIKNIVGIKEASGSIDQATQILQLCNITVLSGDDSLTLPIMSVGGRGVISVVANVVPADTAALTRYCLEGNFDAARKCHFKLFPLCKSMFIETNPIPVKTAMRMLGRLNGEMRLPLCDMTKEHESQLMGTLKNYGLIS